MSLKDLTPSTCLCQNRSGKTRRACQCAKETIDISNESSKVARQNHNTIGWLNPYHAEGYSRLGSTSAKRDYSHDRSKCSTTPSGTIVLY